MIHKLGPIWVSTYCYSTNWLLSYWQLTTLSAFPKLPIFSNDLDGLHVDDPACPSFPNDPSLLIPLLCILLFSFCIWRALLAEKLLSGLGGVFDLPPPGSLMLERTLSLLTVVISFLIGTSSIGGISCTYKWHVNICYRCTSNLVVCFISRIFTLQIFCILQLPISYCVIMVTITKHIFINIFQTEHFSAVKFP